MKQNIKSNILQCAVLIALLITSCTKDGIPGLDWNPNLALPLVKSSFTLKDILAKQNNNNNIVVGSDGFISLVFTTELLSKKAEDLFIIADQNVNSSVKINAITASVFNALQPGASLPQPINVSKSYFLSLDNGLVLDTIALKSGKLHIILNSPFAADFNLQVTLPDARKNNIVLNISFAKNFTGNLPIVVDTLVDLSNYNFSLSSMGNVHNIMNFNYSLQLIKSGTSNITSDSLTVNLTLQDLKFKRIYGKFSNFQLTPEPDSVAISLFDNAAGLGAITLDNPRLTTIIRNSYGIKVDANFTRFEGWNVSATPSTNAISIPAVYNPLTINSPTVIGQSATTQFTLDKVNSNIVAVLNKQPRKVIYQINAITNATQSGFVVDTSIFKVEMQIDLPMSGSINNFIFRDTIDYTFDQGKFLQEVSFRTNIKNGFPFETNLQVFFADSLNNVIDSLVKGKADEQLIASAAVNNLGLVVGAPAAKQSDLKVNAATVPKLINVRKFFITARNSSYQQGLIKLYDTYKLDIQLGVKAKLKL